jgi:aminodeoxyfutalosine synthase
MKKYIPDMVAHLKVNPEIRTLSEKVLEGERITSEEGLKLYTCDNLALLGMLATAVKEKITGDYVFFNRNFHIEPTNICINHCRFCSFRRNPGQKGAWEYSIEEMLEIVKTHRTEGVSEVHIVGGVHPDRDLFFSAGLLKAIRKKAPQLHIKAFTAVEIDQMCQQAGVDFSQGLQILKASGLDSMPGGGAEIFDPTLRAKICPDKTSSATWLKIHEEAHKMGIPSNATLLYGLKETYEHRIDHMNRLRKLQDQTQGFQAFIPLKFKKGNNRYSHTRETSLIEDLKNYSVARIFLDNIAHLKAYWPMIGKQAARISLSFGVDDLDGTIQDTTRIYSMAGSGEQNPHASSRELIQMIKEEKRQPVLRDSLYHTLETY